MSELVSKSWFCVLNNPEEHGFSGSPQEIVDDIISLWIKDNPQRTCAVTYCISSDGLKHCHAVFEDTKALRFSAIKKVYPSMHIEPTKGNKDEAEDYINKRGKYQEKGEIIVFSNRYGEIKVFQGQRRDFDIIEDLLSQGKTPNEIMDISFSFRRYEKYIRDAYYRARFKSTPIKRDVNVYWHVGSSGTGKSYTLTSLSDKYGEESIYLVNDYEHGFDKYNGEPILFMDEFRGQMRHSLLLSLLDGYRCQVPCRYTNAVALWNEVHITSVLPPEDVYSKMVTEYNSLDTFDQLKRRIDIVVYHYFENGHFCTFELPMSEYTCYDDLVSLASDIPVVLEQINF